MKKTIPIILILLLCLCFCNIVSAQPLSFSPSEIMIDGNKGDLIIRQIEIHNDQNISATVSIEYVGENDVYIPNSAIEIPASSTRNINIGFIVNQDEIGWLKYTVGSIVVSQLVIIEITKTTPSLMVFPENPKAGNSIAFMITSGEILDAHGFLFCSESGNIYPINIIDGIGTFKLDDNETGLAVARITGEGITSLFANFTIKEEYNPSENNNNDSNSDTTTIDPNKILSITGPDTAYFGEKKDIMVTKGTSPSPFVSVLVTKPGGESDESATNSFGKISVNFIETGTWKFSIISNNQILTKDISCSKKTESIYLQTNDPVVDDDVKIRTFDDANVIVTYPDGSIDQGFSVANIFTFTPDQIGTYAVKAESTTSKGTLNFDVRTKPKIVITKIDGTPVNVYGSKIGETLYVKLTNHDNDIIKIDTSLELEDLNNIYVTNEDISLDDGVGTWTPVKYGTFTISFSGSVFYDSTDSTISISKTDGGFEINVYAIILIAIIFIIVIIIAKKGPVEFWKKRYNNWKKDRKEKKKDYTPPE